MALLSELVKSTLESLKNYHFEDVIMTTAQKDKLAESIKSTISKANVTISENLFLIETSPSHCVIMPCQYVGLAKICFPLACCLKDTFDFIYSKIQGVALKNVIDLQEKNGKCTDYSDLMTVINQLSGESKDNVIYLLEDKNYNKGFSNTKKDGFRGDLLGAFLLNVVPLTSASNGFFGTFVQGLTENKDFYKKLLDEIKIKQVSNQSVKSSTLNKPHNRIIFGAPGTGKSHKLEVESKQFFNSSDMEFNLAERIKQEIITLGSDRSRSFAVGIKYFEQLKEKKIKDLRNVYNCNRTSAYAIYQGLRVAEKIKVLPDFGDDISDDKVKEQFVKITNEKNMGQAGAAAIGFKYSEFLAERTIVELRNLFGLAEGSSLGDWLYHGVQAANYQFSEEALSSERKIERVTFHPNYSYAQFVGTYKPVQDFENPDNIKYSYVPGPFMRVYVNAVNHPEQNFLLLIEEINRANVAAVFGDVFQLLDRYGKNGDSDGNHAFESEYPVTVSEDMKKYLLSRGISSDELRIPSNMYIWATMNSADQGVLPMDAAFKRRWDFEYLDVDNADAVAQIKDIEIPITRDGSKSVRWNEFRTQLNDKLSDIGVNEDKLLGPFFLSKSSLENAMSKSYTDEFVSLFESKVIMYLFEDVVKMQPGKLFTTGTRRYSKICREFEDLGMQLFGIDVEVFENKAAAEEE